MANFILFWPTVLYMGQFYPFTPVVVISAFGVSLQYLRLLILIQIGGTVVFVNILQKNAKMKCNSCSRNWLHLWQNRGAILLDLVAGQGGDPYGAGEWGTSSLLLHVGYVMVLENGGPAIFCSMLGKWWSWRMGDQQSTAPCWVSDGPGEWGTSSLLLHVG